MTDSVVLDYKGHTIEVAFADLFAQDGVRVIPMGRIVDECTDFAFSLQWQLMRKHMLDEHDTVGFANYAKSVNDAFAGEFYTTIKRDGLELKQFDRGATGMIEHQGNRYLLLALTDTELKQYVVPGANCSEVDFVDALDVLWQNMSMFAGTNDPIIIPLLGTGIEGLHHLDPNVVLHMNLNAIRDAIDAGHLDNHMTTIKIVIFKPKYGTIIDLNQFR